MFNASGKYKPRAFHKRPLHFIFVVVHKCNLRFGKQESQLLLGCANRRLSLMSEGQRPTSGRGKKQFFSKWLQSYSRHDDTVLSNAKINIGIRYSGWRLQASNVAFKIAAKPLQIKMWLLLTAYVKSPSPYPIIPSPTRSTTYRLATVHTLRTDRQTTDTIYRTPVTGAIKLCRFSQNFGNIKLR